jgi:DNA helicase INO80
MWLMHFQVCNHPELFERADIVAPYSFSEFGRSGPLNRQGDFLLAPYSTRNPIEYAIPELLYLDGGLKGVPYDGPGMAIQQSEGVLHKLMSIWKTDWIQRSLTDDGEFLWYSSTLIDMR